MGQLEGLIVGETVRDRQRRYINKSGSKQVEIITYTLTDSNDRNLYFEDYNACPVHTAPSLCEFSRKDFISMSANFFITTAYHTDAAAFLPQM